MHAGPIALLRLYWFRLQLWLRVVLAGALIAAGLALHLRVATALGAVALTLSVAQAAYALSRRRGQAGRTARGGPPDRG